MSTVRLLFHPRVFFADEKVVVRGLENVIVVFFGEFVGENGPFGNGAEEGETVFAGEVFPVKGHVVAGSDEFVLSFAGVPGLEAEVFVVDPAGLAVGLDFAPLFAFFEEDAVTQVVEAHREGGEDFPFVGGLGADIEEAVIGCRIHDGKYILGIRGAADERQTEQYKNLFHTFI